MQICQGKDALEAEKVAISELFMHIINKFLESMEAPH